MSPTKPPLPPCAAGECCFFSIHSVAELHCLLTKHRSSDWCSFHSFLLEPKVDCLVKLFVVAKPHCFCLRTHAHVCHLAFEHEYLRLFFLISETVLYAILYLVAIAVEELPPSNMSITSVLSSMDKITSLRFLVADPVTMLACYSCYSYAHTFSVKVLKKYERD